MRPPQARGSWEHAEYIPWVTGSRILPGDRSRETKVTLDYYPFLEELTLNARPSPRREMFDGWVLNFGDSLTRGANAIYTLYPSSTDVGDKIRECEARYT